MGKARRKERNTTCALLDGDWFTHEAASALETAFTRFDRDGDNALCEAELQAFARACNNGVAFEREELDEIRTYFDTNEADALTRKGFLQLYHTQTVARPADTWKDLKALGFNSKLQPADDQAKPPAALTVASAALPSDVTPTSEGPSVVAHCSRADDLYTHGDHKESLRAAMAAMALDAQSAQAHRCVGRALYALGRVDAAERSWQRANELSGTPTPTAEATPPAGTMTAATVPASSHDDGNVAHSGGNTPGTDACAEQKVCDGVGALRLS